MEHPQVELASPDFGGAQYCLEENARDKSEDQTHGKDVFVEQNELDMTSWAVGHQLAVDGRQGQSQELAQKSQLETGQTYEEEAEVTHESKIQASSYPQLRSMTTRE